MKKHSLFKSEEAVLERSGTLLKQDPDASSIDKSEYISLQKNYRKMFKQLKLLVKMGDIQQNKLNKLNEKLDIQNLFIKKTFGKYLSDDIVKCILDSPQGTSLGGEKRVVTILLTDIRGFTAIAEKESAETIVGILNIYLEIMTEIIFKYGGTIDEFIGDSILVIFGAPVKTTDHADRAVACAIEMQNAMKQVNKKNKAAGFPEVEMGIGINTGELIVGNIGSEKRAKYAVVGSNVNLTSRIESYTVGGQIFISGNTRKKCANKLKIETDFEAKPKGIANKIQIFEVSGIEGDYKLFLEKKKSILNRLSRKIPVIISIFDGKHGNDDGFPGNIIKIGPKEAAIETGKKTEKFSNLKLSINSPSTAKKNCFIYGKVINIVREEKSENYIYSFYFTSIPKNFREIMNAHEQK